MTIVTIINAPPTSISPNEHRERTAETPASFSDIPPVLRHKEENARVVFDPPVEGLTEEELKKGTVYIVESVLAFISESSGRGFQIEYPCIILHAISRSNDSPPCIYCQLGESAAQRQNNNNGGGDEEDEQIDLRELSIFPEVEDSLDTLYEALMHCSSLHPDPSSDSDDGDMMDIENFGSYTNPLANNAHDGDVDKDDDAIVDADVEAIQTITAQSNVDADGELELSETGRVRSDFMNDSRYKPY
ncbi:uncharacterized protein FOMMEDRAFT_102509 [Fomitiporia mediterranea MF3/22]|uniref:uncharacterized protein n=1 Tax=Fomitiporia mediterranea (strain MF3/22) TaxID=694068 RepID=UPI0004409BD7|nr:uncharacterized protein FOMMEDRAFT_102509 [Fomitiporia mediterranea MF3/22]EJD06663.1 hypothetical protein FOMMEDRAFT_102509 [Fomitiporia mediterranea MF3/22]